MTPVLHRVPDLYRFAGAGRGPTVVNALARWPTPYDRRRWAPAFAGEALEGKLR